MSDPSTNLNNPKPDFSSTSTSKDEKAIAEQVAKWKFDKFAAKWKSQEFANAVFDGVDFTGLIDPKKNPLTTSKDKLDIETYRKLAHHFGTLFGYLSLDGEHKNPGDPDGETNLSKAEKAFWAARECLVGDQEALKEFDSMYPREDRPVSVLIEHSSKVYRVVAKRANALAKEMENEDKNIGEMSAFERDSSPEIGDQHEK